MIDQKLQSLIEEFVELMKEGVNVYELKSKALKRHPEYLSDYIVTAIEAADGRLHAEKIGLGDWVARGLFTKIGLQQATHPAISAHHASRFKGCLSILEICTGLGFDTSALARVGAHITSIESDPWVAQCAQHNLALQSITNAEIISVSAEIFAASHSVELFDGLWADPSRRVGEKRTRDVAQYQPSLEWLFSLNVKGVAGIKISPSVNIDELPPGWIREWIGFDRECKEQVLWHGTDLRDNHVTIVDREASWAPKDSIESSEIIAELPSSTPYFIVEPHGALSRSSGLASFFQEQGIALMSEDCPYGFVMEKPSLSPFYEVFEVFDDQKYTRKKLIEQMKILEWDSRTEIKKRNFSEEPDEIFKFLKLPKPDTTNDKFGVILLTRISGNNKMFFAKRVKPSAA